MISYTLLSTPTSVHTRERPGSGSGGWNMASKPTKAWNNIHLLHSITEGLRKERDLASPAAQSTAAAPNKERKQQRRSKENSVSPDTGEAKGTGSERQEESPTPRDPKGESLGQERLALLRGQLRAQLSIREPQENHSPGRRLVELVEKITQMEVDDGAVSANGSAGPEGAAGSVCAVCGQPSDPAGELLAEMEKKLQKELAALRREVSASIEAMQKDVAEELNSLRQTLQAYGERHPLQPSELSPLDKRDEAIAEQLKGTYHRAGRREKPGARIPSALETQFKSRSVSSLCPLPGPSRNQVLIRAMTLTTARNALTAKLGPRSNSDPVDPLQEKSTFLPPANPKPAAKKHPKKITASPTGRGHRGNGKCDTKTASRTVAPRPPSDSTDGNAH